MLLSANEQEVAACREFIFYNCGAEFLRSFDLTWCAHNIKRAEIVNELGSNFAKKEDDSAKKEDAKVPKSKLAKYIKTQQKSSNKTLEFDEDYKA